jgi:hypothetical protein
MTATTDTCWADPLSRAERRVLREKLARACKRFYNTPAGTPKAMLSQIVASAEMSDLHLDVTERAVVPTS